jgi:two-component system response regulator FixJ
MRHWSPLILVVDDDEAVRESLRFALELEDLTVSLCAAGAELFRHPDLARAKCLVLDDMMPHLDGIAVLQGLAERRIDIPVVLMTEHATDRLRQRAARAGARYVIEKPIRDGALMTAIRQLIDS